MGVSSWLFQDHSNLLFALAILVIPLYLLSLDNADAAARSAHARKLKSADTPLEPPLLPYWLPWLGHAHSFLRSSNTLVDRALGYFGSSAPFALHVGGQRLYIVADPADVRAVFRHTRELTFDPFVLEVVRNVYHFSAADQAALTHPRPSGTSIVSESHAYYRTHLTGDSLAVLKARWLSALSAQLDGVRPGSQGALYEWTRTHIATAASAAVMGPGFLAQNPAILPALWDFDDAHIYMLYRLPRLFLRKGFAARDLLVSELHHYLFVSPPPESERVPLIWNRQRRLTSFDGGELPLSHTAVAALQTTIFWAMHTNSVRTAYWTLQHVLADPLLTAAIRTETAPAFSGAALTDADALVDPARCPTLAAAMAEALRLSSGSASSREVERDVVLNSRHLLRAGSKLLTPTIQPHLSHSFWGADAGEFRHTRWLRPDGTLDPRVGAQGEFRPFGGGETYCPGRRFARFQVATWVAAVVRRWEVGLLREAGAEGRGRGSGGGLPVEDRERPAIGILDPKGGQARVVVRERALE
ncbi:cytochrome P450 [Geopyxis carbonaria]|nr:cytochrome P450 [Geopyxis carbonaria]